MAHLTNTILVAVAGLALAAPLHAQRQAAAITPPNGFWFGASAGRGFAQVDCNICKGWRSPAFTMAARAGLRVRPRLLLGVEAGAWMHSEGQVSEHLWTISGVSQIYVRSAPRLFVKAGVSAMFYHIEDTQETLGASGIGILAGAGYDVPLNAQLSLTPSVNLSRSLLGGRLKFNAAELDERAGLLLLQVGLGVTRR